MPLAGIQVPSSNISSSKINIPGRGARLERDAHDSATHEEDLSAHSAYAKHGVEALERFDDLLARQQVHCCIVAWMKPELKSKVPRQGGDTPELQGAGLGSWQFGYRFVRTLRPARTPATGDVHEVRA